MGGYRYDPTLPVINLPDARLNHLFVRDPLRCASVTEYATVAGVDTAEVVEALGPYLDDNTVALEVVGGEVFVLTAPAGRPLARGAVQVAPNLWELLRNRAAADSAYRLWTLLRGMERSGWRVEVTPARILFALGPMIDPPVLGVDIGNVVVPVLPYPRLGALADPTGPLGQYDRAGAAAVAVVCEEAALDEAVTAVRRWILAHHQMLPAMSVLVLEAPRFDPTLLSPGDGAVTPRSVTRHTLESLDWGLDGQ
jgi:hypothetical protein